MDARAGPIRLVARARELTAATPVTDRLRRQLATTRRLGWASSAGEREHGVGSVSAPVLGDHDELIAVVSISGPDLADRSDRGQALRVRRHDRGPGDRGRARRGAEASRFP